jgi:AbrB family looped-hinge helix DNA binding protein
MDTIIVTSRGRIVIPSSVRRRHNIKKGTKLCVIEKEDRIVLTPLTAGYFEKMAGIAKTK